MNPEKEANKNDVYEVIGYAVTQLIASGKPVDKDSILAQLSLGESNSVDGRKKLYAKAIHVVAKSKGGWV